MLLDRCDIVHAQELVFRLVSVHESENFDAKLLARGAEPDQLEEIKNTLKRSGTYIDCRRHYRQCIFTQ